MIMQYFHSYVIYFRYLENINRRKKNYKYFCDSLYINTGQKYFQVGFLQRNERKKSSVRQRHQHQNSFHGEENVDVWVLEKMNLHCVHFISGKRVNVDICTGSFYLLKLNFNQASSTQK